MPSTDPTPAVVPTGPVAPELMLRGVRVLEVSTRVSGAYCGHLLRLLGADVTRVDLPLEADVSPALAAELSASLNDGKAVSAPADVGLAAGHVDLLIIDVAEGEEVPDVAAQVARSVRRNAHEVRTVDLADWVPAQAGSPDARRVRQTGLTSSARSGMAWAIGHPGREPLALPFDLPDYLAGTEAAAAACALLLEAPGSTATYTVNPTSVVANYVGQICSNFVPYGRPWQRSGASASMSGGSYPAAMFRCADGHVSIMCRTNREWLALLSAMGDPEWAEQPGFRDAQHVARHLAAEADAHLSSWLAQRTVSQLLDLSARFKIPVAPVLTVAQAMADERVVDPANCRAAGDGLVFGAPWRFRQPEIDQGSAPARAQWSPVPGQPLAGLRVLDLSWVWAGPMVTGTLRDLGAEVIKVESPGRPDPSRLRGRALVDGQPAQGPPLETSAYFCQVNSGKESVAVDITTEEGRQVVLGLARRCDVVVENMRPGVLDRRGLGYAHLAAENPSLVMASMSIFGPGSPLSEVGGYAPMMTGYSGLDSLVGYDADDRIGLYNPALGDPVGAGHTLCALLAALHHRNQTGRGSWVDVSQVETLVSTLRLPALQHEVAVPANRHQRFWPHGVFRTAGEDSWVAVAVRTGDQLDRLGRLLGWTEPVVAGDPQLLGRLTAWLVDRDVEEIEQRMGEVGIAAAKVRSFEELRDTGWHAARGLVSTARQAYLPELAVFHVPWLRDGVAFTRQDPAPLLGEHTASVLERLLGMTAEDLHRPAEPARAGGQQVPTIRPPHAGRVVVDD